MPQSVPPRYSAHVRYSSRVRLGSNTCAATGLPGVARPGSESMLTCGRGTDDRIVCRGQTAKFGLRTTRSCAASGLLGRTVSGWVLCGLDWMEMGVVYRCHGGSDHVDRGCVVLAYERGG